MTIDKSNKILAEVFEELEFKPYSSQFSKIQSLLLVCHSNAEVFMDKLIIIRGLKDLGLILNDHNFEKMAKIVSLTTELGFKRKLDYIKQNSFLDVRQVRVLNKLNSYRNEFAHSTSEFLIEKYGRKISNELRLELEDTVARALLFLKIELTLQKQRND